MAESKLIPVAGSDRPCKTARPLAGSENVDALARTRGRRGGRQLPGRGKEPGRVAAPAGHALCL